MADDGEKGGWFDDTSHTGATAPPPAGQTTYLEAILAALEDELAEDERVLLIGEDIGVMGGAFRVTEGLWQRSGDRRVIDTPISEIAITGSCIGMAISGLRPIAEFQFADFISCAYDQLVNEAAKLYFRFKCPVCQRRATVEAQSGEAADRKKSAEKSGVDDLGDCPEVRCSSVDAAEGAQSHRAAGSSVVATMSKETAVHVFYSWQSDCPMKTAAKHNCDLWVRYASGSIKDLRSEG